MCEFQRDRSSREIWGAGILSLAKTNVGFCCLLCETMVFLCQKDPAGTGCVRCAALADAS